MAGVRYTVQTAQIASGTTKKTILQILAAANHRVVVKEASVSFKGINNTDPPALFEVLRQSDAGSGGDVITPEKMDPDYSEVIQTTGLKDIDGSAQPTDTGLILSEEVHLQGGYTWQAPFKGDIIVPGGGRLAIAVTSPVDFNVVGRFIAEE